MQVDVICAFTTDGRIAAYDLQPLADNRRFFPPYFAAPVIRSKFLRDHPEVRTVLTRLVGARNEFRDLPSAVGCSGRCGIVLMLTRSVGIHRPQFGPVNAVV
jgi:glycine betaine/choline ABC-type transport system substrate-binding protein